MQKNWEGICSEWINSEAGIKTYPWKVIDWRHEIPLPVVASNFAHTNVSQIQRFIILFWNYLNQSRTG